MSDFRRSGAGTLVLAPLLGLVMWIFLFYVVFEIILGE